jgi:hypothetical protein
VGTRVDARLRLRSVSSPPGRQGFKTVRWTTLDLQQALRGPDRMLFPHGLLQRSGAPHACCQLGRAGLHEVSRSGKRMSESWDATIAPVPSPLGLFAFRSDQAAASADVFPSSHGLQRY